MVSRFSCLSVIPETSKKRISGISLAIHGVHLKDGQKDEIISTTKILSLSGKTVFLPYQWHALRSAAPCIQAQICELHLTWGMFLPMSPIFGITRSFDPFCGCLAVHSDYGRLKSVPKRTRLNSPANLDCEWSLEVLNYFDPKKCWQIGDAGQWCVLPRFSRTWVVTIETTDASLSLRFLIYLDIWGISLCSNCRN